MLGRLGTHVTGVGDQQQVEAEVIQHVAEPLEDERGIGVAEGVGEARLDERTDDAGPALAQ